ncbi:MAG: hypothetical protein GXY07_20685 [Candidatus Hydrogenedentes bacterium]|nr:hypothetical protein [Candidatus Hydrogenedentota bacterium]
MVLRFIAILLAGYAQTEALFTGPVPAEVPTFRVTLGSAPPFHAAIRIDGNWVMDHSVEIKPTQVVDFVPDDPFYTGNASRTLMRNAQIAYEAPAMRRKRLQELWTAQGYAFLNTRSGWRAVKEEDIGRAKRAREMSEVMNHGNRTSSTTLSTTTGTPASENSVRFSPVQMWVIRISILSGAAILLVLIYVFSRQDKGAWTHIN